jgi:hypothetical protein
LLRALVLRARELLPLVLRARVLLLERVLELRVDELLRRVFWLVAMWWYSSWFV